MAPIQSCNNNLEVDVNGEESFILDKDLLCKYSSKLSKLFARSKSTGSAKNLKVFLNDFPGGARTFELLTRFCYHDGKITVTPFNTCLLHSAAYYMEMDKPVNDLENLVQQTEKSLKEIGYWSWNEIVTALKQCQDTMKLETSSSLLKKCVESLVGRLASASEASSCTSSSSSDSSGVRFSCDSKSTESMRNSTFRVTWWFEDLLFLSDELIPIVVKAMVSQKLNHLIISKFLFYYHRSKFTAATAVEKCTMSIAVIDMLYMLDWSLVSFKSLLALLRVTLSLYLDKSCRNKLETMIGSQLDQAALDNLLIPSPNGSNYLYDVNLVLRLVKAFVSVGCAHMSPVRLRNVASLMDLYMSEVAPDPSIKPYKLLALATALPDVARESYDGIYHAVDMYLEVHTGLSKEDKSKLCSALNYHKLSSEACAHLAQNSKFPSKPAVQALISQQYKLNSVLQNITPNDYPCSLISSDGGKSHSDKSRKRVITQDGKLENATPDNQKLKADIHGMHWRVSELENLCKKMQTQMTKIMKSKSEPARHNGMRSLPKLCS